MAKPLADWFDCEANSNAYEHSMGYYCWTCAPYWRFVPVCPTHKRKLKASGFCKDCRKFYDTSNRPA